MMILLPCITLLVFLLCLWLASDKTPLPFMEDHPNHRSLHTKATPHTGGLAALVGIGIAWAWYTGQHGWPTALTWLFPPLFFVAAISFLDDMKNLPALLRLAVHGAAALMLVSSGLTLLGIMGAVISWFAIIWMMNLYNFMDGMDGLAGGMTLFGFVFLGMAAWLSGHTEYAQLAWSVAAASLGFLMLNLPPSRIFMGDIGAITLGMLAAVFSLWGVHDGLFPIWFPVLVFSPFIVDATITLMQRVLRHEKVWQAHREHLYQKLVLAGWPPRKVLLFEYILMFSSGMTGIWLLGATVFWQVTALSIWVMIYYLLIFAQTREAL